MKRALFPLLAVAVTIGLMLLPLLARSEGRARELVLVARGMSFYLDGQPDRPNPVITVEAGELVRVILKNEDAGLTHDFAVPSFKVGGQAVHGIGRAAVTFRVSDTPGRHAYLCTPHAVMMRGIIEVR